MKRFLFVIALLAFSYFSYAKPFIVDGVSYTPISDSTVAVTPIEGFYYYGKIVIPETVCCDSTQFTVVKIDDLAFNTCYSLTDITLPNTIIEIGDNAFNSCKNLKSIILPSSLKKLGFKAFWGCDKLTKIMIPNSVEVIPEFCFEGCSSLSSISLGKSVTVIQQYAFSKCSSLLSIRIPASVVSIKSGAFKDCGKLATVTFENKQNVKIDARNAFANSPYGNANNQSPIANDPRFKIKNSVVY